MGAKTSISWCDHTFNPWWGCAEIGPGCERCYARAFARRAGYPGLWDTDSSQRRYFGDKHWSEPLKWGRAAAAAGVRRRVFCASMADVFDNKVPQEHRDRLWALIRATPDLDWLLVTKRIGNALGMLPENWCGGLYYPNIWMLITVCSQHEADRDVPKLLEITGRLSSVRGLSYEPALGPLYLRNSWLGPKGVNWIIAGGESDQGGKPGRDCEGGFANAARVLKAECSRLGIAFHLKQMPRLAAIPEDLRVQEFPVLAA